MIDLRVLNQIQQQQEMQQAQTGPLAQKAAETSAAMQQQQEQTSPEMQELIAAMQQQREQTELKQKLNNYKQWEQQVMACGGCIKHAGGGSIHIDPSKKGTFTAAASRHGMGVQQFAAHVHAHPENYSPAMRKKANFARNAAKWHHAFGGPLNYFGLGDNITIADLPREYVNAHRNMTVRTPSGNTIPLGKAYSKYGATHINVNDVPGLTDYLITQEQPDIATEGEVNRAMQHRLNQEFNRQIDNFFLGNWLRPSQILGAFNPHGDDYGIPFSQRLLLGTGNTGLVSPEFMHEHPYIGEGLNMVFDVAMPSAIQGIPEMYNAARHNPYTLSRAMNAAARKNSVPYFSMDNAVSPSFTPEPAPTKVFPSMKQYFEDPTVFAEYKQKVLDAYSSSGAVPTSEMTAASNIDELAGSLPRRRQLTLEQFDAINEAFKNGRLQRKYYYSDAMRNRLYDFIDKNGNPLPKGVNRVRQRYLNGGEERLQASVDDAYNTFLESGAAHELERAYNQAAHTSGSPIFNGELLDQINAADATRIQNGQPLLESGITADYKPLNISDNANEALHTPGYSFTINSSAMTRKSALPQSVVNNFVEDSKLGLSQPQYFLEGETFVNPAEIEQLVPEGGDLSLALEDAAAHEPAHLLIPTTYSSPKGFNLHMLSDYLTRHGYTELAARGTQIKNYLERLGIWKEGDPITSDMLKMTADRYPKEVMDNDMTNMFNAVTDWDAAAKWFTKFAPATVGAAVIGAGLVNSEAYGGPLNTYRRGGTLSHQDGMIKSILDRYLTDYRITSAYRGKNNKVGKLGGKSAHAHLLDDGSSAALDIISSDMNRLRRELANPQLQKELAAAGFGILDETDPATMKRTGATGAHFHVGRGIKGGGFHLNGYGHQSAEAPLPSYMASSGGGLMTITSPSQQQAGPTPWWLANRQEPEAIPEPTSIQPEVAPVGLTPDMFMLDWDPVNGRHTSETATYPRLFAEGGFTDIASMIKAHEGFSPTAYKDGKSQSIGYGFYKHGIAQGIDFNKRMSRAEADAILDSNIAVIKGELHRELGAEKYNNLTDGQLAAFVDTWYQSPKAAKKAARIYKRTGDLDAAAKALAVPGFTKRNADRQAAFYGGLSNQTISPQDFSSNTPAGSGELITLTQSNPAQQGFTPWWQNAYNTPEIQTEEEPLSFNPFALDVM